jgi:hypothetical protein
MGQWPELIQELLTSISGGNNPTLKKAALKAIGYVCESIVSICIVLSLYSLVILMYI